MQFPLLIFQAKPDILSSNMKTNIHPVWYPEAKVTCACGSTFTTGSTLEQIRVDICSACHPFYTGQQKFVDTVGRIERFRQKREKAKEGVLKKAREEEKKEEYRPRTLKEMLLEVK